MGVTFAPLQDLQVANKGFQPRYRQYYILYFLATLEGFNPSKKSCCCYHLIGPDYLYKVVLIFKIWGLNRL